MGRFFDALGTTAATFGIGPKAACATLDASGLSAARTLALPNKSDTLATLGDIAAATPTQGIISSSGAAVAISNTAVETTLQSVSIPGGTLGANGAIKVRVSGQYLNNSGATKTCTLRIYYGGTLMYAGTTGSLTAGSTSHAFDLEFALQGAGATNAQSIGGTVSLSAPGGTTGLGPLGTIPTSSTGASPPAIYGTAAVDSTAAQTLQITIQHSAAASTVTFTGNYFMCCVEGVGLQGPTGPVATLPGYISGLQLQYVDATHVSCSSGVADFPNGGGLTPIAAALTATTVFSASTWYHVYLYYNAGNPILTLSTTAPDTPYAGTARGKTGALGYRYLGSVLTDASGNLTNFQHAGNSIRYKSVGSAFRALSNGNATTSTNVACSAFMPITATVGRFSFQLNATAPGTTAYLTPGDIACSSATKVAVVPGSSDGFDATYCECPLGASQSVNYVGPGGGVYLDCLGYEFGR